MNATRARRLRHLAAERTGHEFRHPLTRRYYRWLKRRWRDAR